MTSNNCYNNRAFNGRFEKCELERDSMNNRHDIAGFQAYNETFLDDNGLEVCLEEPYVDFREDLYQRNDPKYRRSIPAQTKPFDIGKVKNSGNVTVGFHKDRCGYVNEAFVNRPRFAEQQLSAEERMEMNRILSTPKKVVPIISMMRDQYESIDAIHRRYEEIETANEEYVDYPEDRMGNTYRDSNYLPNRESPLGSSGTIKHSEVNNRLITPVTTPKKTEGTSSTQHFSTPSKDSTPTRLSRRNTVILAPMIASVEKQQRKMASSLSRSKSTTLSSPRRPIVVRSTGRNPNAAVMVAHNINGSVNTLPTLHRQNSGLGKSMQSIVVPKYHTPLKLHSFNHLIESDIMEPALERMRTPNRRPNTAIISPNMRSSIAPLLPTTPPITSSTSPGPPAKSPSNYSKVSWATLPTIHLPTEMLCLFGFILLTAGAATTILCFYLLSIGGRKYFLNFGATAGCTSFILGMLSCRTNKWKWLPHRNYLTGYILLGTFSVLNTACLGGAVYALQAQSYALLDTLGGAVCGISTLLCTGSILGMITSGCCHRPPPDNRVAHCVTGFRV